MDSPAISYLHYSQKGHRKGKNMFATKGTTSHVRLRQESKKRSFQMYNAPHISIILLERYLSRVLGQCFNEFDSVRFEEVWHTHAS